jgi:hypothetical protein
LVNDITVQVTYYQKNRWKKCICRESSLLWFRWNWIERVRDDDPAPNEFAIDGSYSLKLSGFRWLLQEDSIQDLKVASDSNDASASTIAVGGRFYHWWRNSVWFNGRWRADLTKIRSKVSYDSRWFTAMTSFLQI